jgi:hypothetical protein
MSSLLNCAALILSPDPLTGRDDACRDGESAASPTGASASEFIEPTRSSAEAITASAMFLGTDLEHPTDVENDGQAMGPGGIWRPGACKRQGARQGIDDRGRSTPHGTPPAVVVDLSGETS